MKKWFSLILVLVLMSVSVFALAEGEQPAANELLSSIQKKGSLVIGTEGNWSPWTYHDENDVLTGYDIEVGTLLAKGLGVTPDFKEAEWSALLAGVDSGVFDIVCNGVGYTPDRAEKYAFSDPYIYSEVVLVVRGDNETIHSLEDLAGKKTSNSPGSTYATRAEAVGAEVMFAESLNDTIALVLQGRVDATINAKGSLDGFLAEHPDANIKIVAVLPGEPVVFPVRKGAESDTLVAAINAILAKAREDGSLAELSVKYFGTDLTNPE